MKQSAELKRFRDHLNTNDEARQKIDDLYAKNKENLVSEVIAFAHEHGFKLTAEDVLPPEGELDVDLMSDISGGRTLFKSRIRL